MVNPRYSQQNQTRPSALHRRAQRAERGAAVFIVVMVLTLLTAVGLFAVRSASLADLAAGYDREGAQAALVAEYAITASAAYLANDSTTVLSGFDLSRDLRAQPCQTNAIPAGTYPGPSPRPGCYMLGLDEVQNSFRRTTGESVFALPTLVGPSGSTSSLNIHETTNATFVVEVTDAAHTGVPEAGAPVSGPSPILMTLTAISQVRPAAACAAPVSVAPAAGQQVMRAMVVAEGILQ